MGWTFLLCGAVFWFGIQIELAERRDPTPAEWSFRDRHVLREARSHTSREVVEMTGFVDWMAVGRKLQGVLVRLESVAQRVAGGEEVVQAAPVVGGVGLDVSGQTWAWRSGYYDVVMGCAQAAEHLDGMVVDTTRGIVFPKEVVIGPSNPDPRPLPAYTTTAPLEENCARPFEAPETFYFRILTGAGFTTKQKLSAALACANWFRFQGLNESAEEMYRWGVDIATAALPIGTSVADVIDSKTLVLADSDKTTANLLEATTELAVHRARSGDLSSALPIFLSVLRARRHAPVSPFPEPSEQTGPSSSSWTKFFKPAPFPPPPPSGDIPMVRTNAEPTCEESEVMLYVGEILFATSSTPSQEGIGWTRSAIDIAEKQLNEAAKGGNRPDRTTQDKQRKCKECLVTGVSNLEAMLLRLDESLASEPTMQKRGWFGHGGQKDRSADERSFREGKARVRELRIRIDREELDEQLPA